MRADINKTSAKFQKDPAKIVGGVAVTRLDTICDGQSNIQTDRRTHRENNMSPYPAIINRFI